MPDKTKYTPAIGKSLLKEVAEEAKAKGDKPTVNSVADSFISKAKARGIDVEDARTKKSDNDVNKKISDEVQKEIAAKGKKATEDDFVKAHIRISKKHGIDVQDMRQKKAAALITQRTLFGK